MKKLLSIAFALAVLLSVTAPEANALGVFYSDVTYPLQATASEASLSELREGTSVSKNYLYLIEVGDAGINAAAKDAGISEIHHVDVHIKNYFVFFQKVTTKVYGK